MHTQVTSVTLYSLLASCFKRFPGSLVSPKIFCLAGQCKGKHKLQTIKDNINLDQGTYLLPLHLTVLKYVIKFIQTGSKRGEWGNNEADDIIMWNRFKQERHGFIYNLLLKYHEKLFYSYCGTTEQQHNQDLTEVHMKRNQFFNILKKIDSAQHQYPRRRLKIKRLKALNSESLDMLFRLRNPSQWSILSSFWQKLSD